jgi:hypothetical protein
MPLTCKEGTEISNPIAQLCDEDIQAKQFETLVKLWIKNKITYESLMKNFPVYESSMLRKIVNYILVKTT